MKRTSVNQNTYNPFLELQLSLDSSSESSLSSIQDANDLLSSESENFSELPSEVRCSKLQAQADEIEKLNFEIEKIQRELLENDNSVISGNEEESKKDEELFSGYRNRTIHSDECKLNNIELEHNSKEGNGVLNEFKVSQTNLETLDEFMIFQTKILKTMTYEEFTNNLNKLKYHENNTQQ